MCGADCRYFWTHAKKNVFSEADDWTGGVQQTFVQLNDRSILATVLEAASFFFFFFFCS
jgi:hypothetical protein